MMLRELFKLLRPYQWAKNLLVLTALAASHRLGERAAWSQLLLLFAAFCAVASAVYVLNDWLDREHDRAHPDKCRRPFASGRLSTAVAFWVIPILLVIGVAFAWALPLPAQLSLLTYGLLSLAYCTWLKRLRWLDLLALSSLYVLRVAAGAFAIGVSASGWLLAFVFALFLSLAAIKRLAELRRASGASMPGRGYAQSDLPAIRALAAASGLLAVLVLACYAFSAQGELLYRAPGWLIAASLLLLGWLARMGQHAQSGRLRSEPLLHALRDLPSHVIGTLFFLLLWLAS